MGLAAPQVGVNVRLMVFNPAGRRGEGEELVLANPRIASVSKGRDLAEEGCLSFHRLGTRDLIRADVEVGLETMWKQPIANGLCFSVQQSSAYCYGDDEAARLSVLSECSTCCNLPNATVLEASQAVVSQCAEAHDAEGQSAGGGWQQGEPQLQGPVDGPHLSARVRPSRGHAFPGQGSAPGQDSSIARPAST